MTFRTATGLALLGCEAAAKAGLIGAHMAAEANITRGAASHPPTPLQTRPKQTCSDNSDCDTGLCAINYNSKK